MRTFLSLTAVTCLSLSLHAQGNFATQGHGFVHEASKEYEWPTDPEVLRKLDQWQDRKFGIMCSLGSLLRSRHFGVMGSLFGRPFHHPPQEDTSRRNVW